jgi:quercetin dioxygenase-like cupin family protein
MRKLTTGVDEDGRSRLIELRSLDLVGNPRAPGVQSAVVAETASSPPPSRPAGKASTSDLGVKPGLLRWFVVEYEANLEIPMHHTDTVDFDIVLDGSLVLGLDDGEHLLQTDDILIVNGVDHSWRAGPSGCRLSVLSIGTPPPV